MRDDRSLPGRRARGRGGNIDKQSGTRVLRATMIEMERKEKSTTKLDACRPKKQHGISDEPRKEWR